MEKFEDLLKKPIMSNFNKMREAFRFSSDDEVILNELANYLKNSIVDFSYTRTYDKNRHLKNCFHYLNYEPSKLDIEDQTKFYENMSIKLLDIKNEIDLKLQENDMVGSMTNINANKELLKRLKMEIDDFHRKHRTINYINKQNQDGIYSCLKQLIFCPDEHKLNHAQYLTIILEQFPYLVNLKGDNNKYLLDEVFEYFLALFDFPNHYVEKLRLEQVVFQFLKSPLLEVESDVFCSKLHKLYDRLKRKDGEELIIVEELIAVIKQYKNNSKLNKQREEYLKEKYHFKYEFNQQEINELQSLNIDYENYLDETNKKVITIDASKDAMKEDAIFYENNDNIHHFIYYVADVLPYILPDTELDKNAKYYAREHVYVDRFLPPVIAKKISFDKNKKRPAIAFEYFLDQNGSIIKKNIRRSIIQVEENYDYKDISDIFINSKSNNVDYFSKLYYLSELVKYQNYDLQKEIVSEEVFKDNIEKMKSNGKKNFYFIGSQIISQITNYLQYDVATIPLPLINRVGMSMKSEQLDLLKAELPRDLSVPKSNDVTLNSLITSTYLPSSRVDELGLDKYTEVSSPARSYASLLNLRILSYYILNEKEMGYNYMMNLLDNLEDECFELNGKKFREFYYKEEKNKELKKRLTK